MVGHPGEGEKERKQSCDLLASTSIEGEQFQIFMPTPLTLSSAMYYLGFHPISGEYIQVEKNISHLDKFKLQLISQKKGKNC
jgi:radical SAM superfamily enzyme YgiQ (UPF0313 family)